MKKIIAFTLAFIMVFALCSGFASASGTVRYEAVSGVCNGSAFICSNNNISLTIDLTDYSYVTVNFNGYIESSNVTGGASGFAFYYRNNLITGVSSNGSIILTGNFSGRDYTFTLVKSTSGSSGNMTREELIADARSQGVEVPDNIVISDPNGRYVTVYTADQDNTTRFKSKPLDGNTSCIITNLRFPFNAYVYGTIKNWTLIKTDDGVYGYIWTSLMGFADITSTDSNARRGQGLVDMLKGQGVTIPDDFYFSDVTVGRIRNESGSPYYALYKYKTPDKYSDSYGKFYYYNPNESKTAIYKDTMVVKYGHYGSFALYQSESGEFFWADATSFFKPV